MIWKGFSRAISYFILIGTKIDMKHMAIEMLEELTNRSVSQPVPLAGCACRVRCIGLHESTRTELSVIRSPPVQGILTCSLAMPAYLAYLR